MPPARLRAGNVLQRSDMRTVTFPSGFGVVRARVATGCWSRTISPTKAVLFGHGLVRYRKVRSLRLAAAPFGAAFGVVVTKDGEPALSHCGSFAVAELDLVSGKVRRMIEWTCRVFHCAGSHPTRCCSPKMSAGSRHPVERDEFVSSIASR